MGRKTNEKKYENATLLKGLLSVCWHPGMSYDQKSPRPDWKTDFPYILQVYVAQINNSRN